MAALMAAAVALASWLIGFTRPGIVVGSIAAFVFGLLSFVLEDDAEIQSRQRVDSGSTDVLAQNYVLRLRKCGWQSAVNGFNILVLMFAAFHMRWAVTGVLAACLAMGCWTLWNHWRGIRSEPGTALHRAATWYVPVMLVFGALAAHGTYEAVTIIRRIGKSWPKAMAFGADPRLLAGCSACLALVAGVWLVNRRLAASIASDAARNELRTALPHDRDRRSHAMSREIEQVLASLPRRERKRFAHLNSDVIDALAQAGFDADAQHRSQVSDPIRDPVNWQIAAGGVLVGAVLGWFLGESALIIGALALILGAVAFFGAVIFDRNALTLARLQDEGSRDSEVTIHAIRLRSDGSTAAMFGMILAAMADTLLFRGAGLPIYMMAAAAPVLAFTLYREWPDIRDEMSGAFGAAWQRHVATMAVIGAVVMAIANPVMVAGIRATKTMGLELPLGIALRHVWMAVMGIVVIGCLWLANRWLALGAAENVADQEW